MANAVLEKTMDRVAEEDDVAGWAATSGGAAAATLDRPVTAAPTAERTDAMTLRGVMSATGVFFVLLLAAGWYGWGLVDPDAVTVEWPGWLIFVLLGAFVLAMVTAFKPRLAVVSGPIYAIAQGVALGSISRLYELQWDGIVVQAVLLTAFVFASMLFLYATRIIKVTDRMRKVVIGATMAIAAFYLVSLLLSFFDVGMPLIWDSGPLGIAFSVLVVGIAAFSLTLDFDLAERGVAAGFPRYMEWYTAFALMTSLVWLYLEVLRLLSKLRQ